MFRKKNTLSTKQYKVKDEAAELYGMNDENFSDMTEKKAIYFVNCGGAILPVGR
jgi:hypothetical protein